MAAAGKLDHRALKSRVWTGQFLTGRVLNATVAATEEIVAIAPLPPSSRGTLKPAPSARRSHAPKFVPIEATRARGATGTGGGRNRRGRNERNDRPDRAAAPETTEAPQSFEAPIPPPVIAVEAGELGEGAPGADGSRRWRGRRGRRRGRSGLPGDVVREAATPEPTSDAELLGDAVEVDFAPESEELRIPDAKTGPILNAYADADRGEDELARSAAPLEGQPSGDRSRGGRGGRGGRNERGDRNDRSERSDRGERSDRAPRGFAPSTNLYGVEAHSSDGESEAPVEPMILPGESLSKYRRGSEAEASQTSMPAPSLPPNVVLAKPANIIDDSFVAASWDGGAVLPGETLSRRNRPEARPDSRREDGRVNRESRRGLSSQPSVSHQQENEVAHSNFAASLPEQPAVVTDLEGVSVVSAPEEQPEVAQAAHFDQASANEFQHDGSALEDSETSPLSDAPETRV